MSADVEEITSTENTIPRRSSGEALSTGWRATIGAVCLGWPYLLVLVGGTVILGMAYGMNGTVESEVLKALCIAVFAISLCISFVQIARIAMRLVCGLNVQPTRWAYREGAPVRQNLTAIIASIISTLNLVAVIVPGSLFVFRFGMALRFAVCDDLPPLRALAESWRTTSGWAQEVGRVAGTVTVAIAACVVALTALLAVVLSQNALGTYSIIAVKWSHSLLAEAVIVAGLIWMHASIAALVPCR